jgi:hypothetical protein
MTVQVESEVTASPGDGSIAGMFKWIQWTIDTHELIDATASSLRTACVKVLDVVDDHNVPVDSIDVDDVTRKFHNKHRGTMKDATLDTYEQRFRQTVEMYKKWLVKDDSWRPAQRKSSAKKSTPNGKSTPADKGQVTSPAEQQTPKVDPPPQPGMITYPFPIRPGMQGRIMLPEDLTMREAKRIAAFVSTLAFEDEPEPPKALLAGHFSQDD